MVVQVKSLKALQVPSDFEKILYQICFFVIKFFNESTYLLLFLSLRKRTLGHHMSLLSTTKALYPHRSSSGFIVGGFLCRRGGAGNPELGFWSVATDVHGFSSASINSGGSFGVR